MDFSARVGPWARGSEYIFLLCVVLWEIRGKVTCELKTLKPSRLLLKLGWLERCQGIPPKPYILLRKRSHPASAKSSLTLGNLILFPEYFSRGSFTATVVVVSVCPGSIVGCRKMGAATNDAPTTAGVARLRSAPCFHADICLNRSSRLFRICSPTSYFNT